MAVENNVSVGVRAGRKPRLGPGDLRALVVMGGVILALHVIGWGLLAGVVAPHRYDMGSSGVFGLGLGLTAYLLGMRHAFDADHIAAIDNTTRSLMGAERKPRSVGFFFSLGHSSVVFGLVVLLALGLRALAGQLGDDSSVLQQITGTVGVSVSGTFLIIIGVINLLALVGIVKVFRRLRHGELDEAELERQLANRGFLARILSGATKAVRRPWQMYPVGFLFGLGFDTATEIGLLLLASGAAAFALPWYAILTLPILFAAGMCLLDTADGWFMSVAYDWAFARPVRKIYYNIVITGLSVAVALVIGGIELISIVTDKAGIGTGPLAAIGAVDLGQVGYLVVGLFVVTWVAAISIWRFGRVEERMSQSLR